MTTERERIIAEAKSWLGTPFHHGARVKGAGVDCAQFVAAVYESVGVSDSVEFPEYKKDWFLHSNDERYCDTVLSQCIIVDTPLPGDIVLFRRQPKKGSMEVQPYSHGAIVIEWPLVIQARWKANVELCDATSNPLCLMPHSFFRSKKLVNNVI